MRYIIIIILFALTSCKVYTIDASTLSAEEREALIQSRNYNNHNYNILYPNSIYNDLWWYNNNWRYNNNINIFKYNKRHGNNTRNVNPSRGSRGAGTSVNRQPNRPKTKQAPPTRLPQRHKGRGKKQYQ